MRRGHSGGSLTFSSGEKQHVEVAGIAKEDSVRIPGNSTCLEESGERAGVWENPCPHRVGATLSPNA